MVHVLWAARAVKMPWRNADEHRPDPCLSTPDESPKWRFSWWTWELRRWWTEVARSDAWHFVRAGPIGQSSLWREMTETRNSDRIVVASKKTLRWTPFCTMYGLPRGINVPVVKNLRSVQVEIAEQLLKDLADAFEQGTWWFVFAVLAVFCILLGIMIDIWFHWYFLHCWDRICEQSEDP